MKIGVIQSSFIPWRGYFDFIRSVDTFVFYEDVQFSKNSWRNRNKVKTAAGLRWLTVPVKIESLGQRICDTRIDYSRRWRASHEGILLSAYRRAPFQDYYFDDYLRIIGEEYDSISSLNIALIRWVMGSLSIATQTVVSTDYELVGSKTDRLVSLLEKLSASSYLSGPSANSYLNEEQLRNAGIALQYKTYNYLAYPQQWDGYEAGVSILDTLFNCGPDRSRELLVEKV